MKILVIDDEPFLLSTVEAYLLDSGYQVVTAGNGRVGLEAFKTDAKIEFVFVDLRMPVMDGLSFIGQASALRPEIPLVVLSGVGDIDDIMDAIRIGAWDFVAKPIANFRMVDHAIKRNAERARFIRERRQNMEQLENALDRLEGTVRERTEDLRRANADLRKSEEWFRRIVETLNEGFMTIGADLRITSVNTVMCGMVGYREDELLGREFSSLLFTEDIQLHRDELERRRQGIGCRFERRFRRKDGSELWTIFAASAIMDDAGEFNGAFALYTDITERKAAERALIASEKRLHDLIENAPVGIFETNACGAYRLVNPCLARMFGFDQPEDMVAGVRHVVEQYADKKTHGLIMRQLKRQGQVTNQEIEVRRFDGSTMWMSLNAKVIRDDRGRIAYFDGFSLDITEQKRVRKELEDSEERYRRIVETANEGIFAMSANERIAFANRRLAEMLKTTPEELVGRSIYDNLFPEDIPAIKDRVERRRQGITERYERRLRAKDGSEVWTIISATPVFAKDGSFAGSFAMFTDITERKRIEEQVRMMNRDLEGLVAQRTRDLAEKAAKLEAANKRLAKNARKLVSAKRRAERATNAKSIFLANMSHEVRTPLNVIMGMADLALRGQTGDEQRYYFNAIREHGGKLLTLISDILDFSKIEAGKLSIGEGDYDPVALARQTMREFSDQAGAKRLDLRLETDPGLPAWLVGDASRIGQVLANLVGNAVKFTREGFIAVRLFARGGEACFQVADTGVGVAPDKKQEIFESFTQADEHLGGSHGGVGLGLAISRRLAGLMRGKLTLDDRPGGGSVFTLCVPLRRGKPPGIVPDAACRPAALAQTKPLRILVAEDHEMGRELLVRFLTGQGHVVATAVDGEEALSRLASGDFDLVLMDGRMPGMDGYAATRRIRDGAAGQDKAGIPVVIVTAQAMKGDRELYMQSGADDYLTKPVDLDELECAIARHARGKSASPAAEAGPQQAAGPNGSDGLPPVLDRAAALAKLKGMTGLLEGMEKAFYANLGPDLDGLRQAVGRADPADARMWAHRIKGTAVSVGAMRLGHAALDLETLAASGAAEEFGPGLARVEEAARELLALTGREEA